MLLLAAAWLAQGWVSLAVLLTWFVSCMLALDSADRKIGAKHVFHINVSVPGQLHRQGVDSAGLVSEDFRRVVQVRRKSLLRSVHCRRHFSCHGVRVRSYGTVNAKSRLQTALCAWVSPLGR